MNMNKVFIFLTLSIPLLAACGSIDSTGVTRKAGANETEIIVQRADMPINSGFVERIYVDGKQVLSLGNGKSGRILVSHGEHTIHATLYTMTSEKLSFTAAPGNLQILVTPYSMNDFAIELLEDDASPQAPVLATVPAAAKTTASKNTDLPATPAAMNASGVEGSLARAAYKIMVKITQDTRIAIVYVTSKDVDTTDFIAGELEVIMTDQGFYLIDRSQLDKIRAEKQMQLSGEVDDAKAVSVGKEAGADVIITGAVTGDGNLRRLRLRALETETARVVVASSEKF